MDKRSAELKSFATISLLQPNQSPTISFVIDAKPLSSYDAANAAWIAEAGVYSIKVGASSTNIQQTATFGLPKEMVVEKCHKVLAPQVEIKELSK